MLVILKLITTWQHLLRQRQCTALPGTMCVVESRNEDAANAIARAQLP